MNKCPSKLEPVELNHEARSRLSNIISHRMELASTIIERDMEFANQHAREAQIQATGFSLDATEKELNETAQWMQFMVNQLTADIKRIKDVIIPLAQEIKSKEDTQ